MKKKKVISDMAEQEKMNATKELKEAESALATLKDINRRAAVENSEK
eukprot:CAMPEP_0196821188 /NCGR_PEP_ID=MMETSP1362-20130617/78152_1 /TAXON_ID=163516 /ORGANISM="Leptocylindrus danicus, Strain CCMP1856" /LENGTH=46 /DNA_ID= /DNA_START= /DNA_END= /DNA_ORIENTATION=